MSAARPGSDLLPTATPAQARRAVRRLVRGRRVLALVAVAALVAGTVAGLVVPRLVGHLVDLVLEGHGAGAVTGPVLLIALLGVAQSAFTAVGATLVARVGESSLAQLREQVVERTLELPARSVERAGTGDLLSRVSDDVAQVADAVRGAVPELASAALTVGLTLVGLLALDWRLALAALVGAPVQAYAAVWYLRRSTPVYAAQRVAAGRRTHQLIDSLGGAETVRAFGLTGRHVAAVRARSAEALELDLHANRIATRFFGRLNLAEFLGLASILVVGFTLVRAETISVGATAAAALYFHRLFDPINSLLGLLGTLQEGTAALARLVGVADLPAPATAPRQAPVPAAEAEVVADRLRLGYGRGDRHEAGDRNSGVHEVLHDVSMRIAPGERVALVGASGAGKTTLAAAIAGAHPAISGTVSIGGRPVGELGPGALRHTVGWVTQEVHVFAGTLAEDLRLVAPEATDADLEAALRTVGADWAGRLPDGLETRVGDGGHRLTAAQAQQLAFARLVLLDPAVVVLDEATADAGSAGARVLERVAERVLTGRTGLVVAHRLTQAAAADRIVVLDDGVVTESGTHRQLVAAGGVYARLWSAWSGSRDRSP
ncbi:MAG: ABC transporter ATP-binding protein [Nocardioides sp.]|uniref:ABC transporter ATP-binding protein n=1 Tax=Nocardioides sp. TaxID=35761 RepID=UPI0039E452AA